MGRHTPGAGRGGGEAGGGSPSNQHGLGRGCCHSEQATGPSQAEPTEGHPAWGGMVSRVEMGGTCAGRTSQEGGLEAGF